MADIDFDDYDVPPRMNGGQAQKLIHLTGAACSLALIVGMALWGYRLAVRDVSGVPVVRAMEGPMRVAPSNPGGSIADHQGMAVNVVAAAGGTAGMPAEIILAPPPVDLTADDAPGLSPLDPVAEVAPPVLAPLGLTMGPNVVVPSEVPEAQGAVPPAAELAETAPVTTQDAVAMALAEALGDAQPLAALDEGETLDTSGERIAGSVRPRARPQSGFAEVTAVEPVSAALALGPEIDPATLTAGTRLVQLGAFDSAEIARAEWARVRGRFGDLMTGKSLVVQSAQSGGRTFYRLRAHGFEGEDDARRFCAALVAENAACIPVAHR
ncbi:MAG: SPOR domain-containing protein [Pseudotabrizicola sp.]|uniref:SPOR domain-containing protein n=1 Tax=Pseudotabrizicola sp. TaxID=2939647 RepID=UPI0027233580|nr:SPOR domain-containing protein [Pseudotabrizicola sp.]MDO9638561.1 SPOR domain-containing protein [Pseudotabrizicola sp.]